MRLTEESFVLLCFIEKWELYLDHRHKDVIYINKTRVEKVFKIFTGFTNEFACKMYLHR